MFDYDVRIHIFFSSNNQYWDEYSVKADCLDHAKYSAIMRVKNECGEIYADSIDLIEVYSQSGTLLREYAI